MNINRLIIRIALIPALCMSLIPSISFGKGGFYDGTCKYRGFYWFDDPRQEKKKQIEDAYQNPTAEEATKSLEQRKKELDDARAQMIELAYRENVPNSVLRDAVIKYKKLEVKMFDGALRLVDASEMANFVDPKLSGTDTIPTNVYANKIKRKVDAKVDAEVIRSFAKKYDLILFKSDECPYCKAFIPIITHFAKHYEFDLESADLESEAGRLAQNIGVDGVPTVVAMSKDGKDLFEINRGMNSMSDLEHSVLLADKYSHEQNSKRGKRK